MQRVSSSRMPYFVILFLYYTALSYGNRRARFLGEAGAPDIAMAPPARPGSGIREFASWQTSTNSLIVQTLPKVFCIDLLTPPDEPTGEKDCWGHHF